MALFNWLAEYYRHPLGQVISTALPLANSLRPARSKAEKSIRVLDLPNSDSPPKLGPVQQELLEFINGKAWIPFRLIRRIIPGADNAAKGLAAKGLAEIRYQETRLEKTDLGREYSVPRELSPEQTLALEQLGPALESREFAPFLLHGVTGSGKTEVYLRAGEKTLEQGRAALILVPEIALTPALTGQFEARFQDRVAVLHSGLTPAERMGEWLRLLEGRARVALGARSAVFAPLTDLGPDRGGRGARALLQTGGRAALSGPGRGPGPGQDERERGGSGFGHALGGQPLPPIPGQVPGLGHVPPDHVPAPAPGGSGRSQPGTIARKGR